jgi:hypothetical protein
MTTRHTPGPIKEYEFENWSRDPASMPVVDRARLINWACDHWHEVQRNSVPNPLHAQAPAMAEVLREAVTIQFRRINTDQVTDAEVTEWYTQARTLLAAIEQGAQAMTRVVSVTGNIIGDCRRCSQPIRIVQAATVWSRAVAACTCYAWQDLGWKLPKTWKVAP